MHTFLIYSFFSVFASVVLRLIQLAICDYPLQVKRSRAGDVLELIGKLGVLLWCAWLLFVKGGPS